MNLNYYCCNNKWIIYVYIYIETYIYIYRNFMTIVSYMTLTIYLMMILLIHWIIGDYYWYNNSLLLLYKNLLIKNVNYHSKSMTIHFHRSSSGNWPPSACVTWGTKASEATLGGFPGENHGKVVMSPHFA